MRAPFQLGPWTVDPRVGELTGPGQPAVRLRARVMDLLVFFAEHPGEVLTKDDLLHGVWQTEAISESALTRTIAELRQALGDEVDQPAFLETIPKRGYRLIAPVRWSVGAGAGDARAESAPGEGSDSTVVSPLVTAPAAVARRAPPSLTRHGTTVLVALVLVAVGAAAAWYVVAVRSAQRGAPVTFTAREWVLVAAFDNRTGRPEFDGTLELALEHELSNSAFVNVSPRERIEDALRLMVRPITTRVDAAIGREVALRDGGIRVVIAGAIERLGDTHAMTVQILNPHDGIIVASRREEVAVDAQIAPAVRRLSNWIRTSLGEQPLAVTTANRRLEKATTSSLRALRLYSEGLAAFKRSYLQWGMVGEQKFEEAEAFLSAAITGDPELAVAHIWLAWTQSSQLKHADDYLAHARRAASLADRATDRERYFILGSYHMLGGDYAKAVGFFEALLRLYPDDFWGLVLLSRAYGALARHADAANILVRAASVRPNDFEFAARAALLVFWSEGLDAARPTVQRARILLDQLRPSANPDVVDGQQGTLIRRFPIHDHWVQRRIGDASTLLEGESVRHAELPSWWYHRASFYLTLGQLRRGVEAATRIPDDDIRRLALACFAFTSGDSMGVARQLEGYTGGDPMAVVLLARAGHPNAAARVEQRPAFSGNPHRHAMLAEIGVARGSLAEAEVPLRSVIPAMRGGARRYMHSETIAHLMVRRGDVPGAIRVMEETRPGLEFAYNPAGHTGYWWMRAQLRLADLYRRVGRVSEARVIEGDLLARLRHADADHPMLMELKKRN
jgi:DNA-binding winged helix-turn-helix (wHTH) protein/tetratricopeptide (TPR) repeat protein